MSVIHFFAHVSQQVSGQSIFYIAKGFISNLLQQIVVNIV